MNGSEKKMTFSTACIKWKPSEISIPPFNKLFAEEGFIPK